MIYHHVCHVGLKKALQGENYPRMGDRVMSINIALDVGGEETHVYFTNERDCDKALETLYGRGLKILYPNEERRMEDWKELGKELGTRGVKSITHTLIPFNIPDVEGLPDEPYITYQSDAVGNGRRVSSFNNILWEKMEQYGVKYAIDLSNYDRDIVKCAAAIKKAVHHVNVNSGFLHIAMRSTTDDKITMVIPEEKLEDHPAWKKWMPMYIPHMPNMTIRSSIYERKFKDLGL